VAQQRWRRRRASWQFKAYAATPTASKLRTAVCVHATLLATKVESLLHAAISLSFACNFVWCVCMDAQNMYQIY
jgi:hypothetical protein